MAELTLAQVYRRAHRTIVDRGWFQGDFVGPRGCVCIIGALSVAIGGAPTQIPEADPQLFEQAWTFLETLIDSRSIARWNDDTRRTEDEVFALLNRAAEEAERRG